MNGLSHARLSLAQQKVVIDITQAEIESIHPCEDPFVAIIVRGNRREPRMLTAWNIPGADPEAVPKLITGIHIDPDVEKGFYCGEIVSPEAKFQLAFTTKRDDPYLRPHFEIDRTGRGKETERWREASETFIWGDVTEIKIDRTFTQPRIVVKAGGRESVLQWRFIDDRLVLH